MSHPLRANEREMPEFGGFKVFYAESTDCAREEFHDDDCTRALCKAKIFYQPLSFVAFEANIN